MPIKGEYKNKDSNTTLVKVKQKAFNLDGTIKNNSNTTLVKVKCHKKRDIIIDYIQIQHLLKLNVSKINHCECLSNSNTTLVKVKLLIQQEKAQKKQQFKYNTC